MNRDVYDFDEAIALMGVGASGFTFRNLRGGLASVSIDPSTNRPVITAIVPKEGPEA